MHFKLKRIYQNHLCYELLQHSFSNQQKSGCNKRSHSSISKKKKRHLLKTKQVLNTTTVYLIGFRFEPKAKGLFDSHSKNDSGSSPLIEGEIKSDVIIDYGKVEVKSTWASIFDDTNDKMNEVKSKSTTQPHPINYSLLSE